MRFLRLNLRRQRTARPGRRTGPTDRRKNSAHASAIPMAEERRRGEDDRRNGPRSRLVSGPRSSIDSAAPGLPGTPESPESRHAEGPDLRLARLRLEQLRNDSISQGCARSSDRVLPARHQRTLTSCGAQLRAAHNASSSSARVRHTFLPM